MGFSVVTTVLAGAVTQNLTDLATAKDELSIAGNNTTNDSWLGRAIAQVSQSIASYTKRVFLPELVQDVFDIQQDAYLYQTPGGFPLLQLARWPVVAVQSVTQTFTPGSPEVLVEGQDFRTDPGTGQLLRLNPFTGAGMLWDAAPVTVRYVAGYGAIVTEADLVPAVAPYQLTVSQAATFSCPLSASYASGTPLTAVAANPGQGQYSVTAGVYTFNPADAAQAPALTYAVAAIPFDLVDICLRLITSRYAAKDRDPALVQQDTPGVGTQRWWFGGAPGQKGPFPPDIEGALEVYCTSVVY